MPLATDMQWHPAANLFPMMPDAELRALAEDIKAHGLRSKIVLLSGTILDGRNRHRACVIAGVEPEFDYVNVTEIGDPFLFVASLNLHRRHLDESQRAMVGSKLKAHFAALAKERQRGGQGGVLLSADLREATVKASEQAAVVVNVSPRLIDAAAHVHKHGAPELVDAVERGAVKVSAAAEIARLPVAQQSAVVAAGPAAVVAEAKAQRDGRKGVIKPDRAAVLALLGRAADATTMDALNAARAAATDHRPALTREEWEEFDGAYFDVKRALERRSGVTTPDPVPSPAKPLPVAPPPQLPDLFAGMTDALMVRKASAVVDQFLVEWAAVTAGRDAASVKDPTARGAYESAATRVLDAMLAVLPDEARAAVPPRLSVIRGGQ